MLANAIRQILDRFPLDPPGEVEPGHFVRIRGDETLIYGHLQDVIGPVITVQSHDHPIEFIGGSASRVTGGAETALPTEITPAAIEAKFNFDNGYGLVIVGTRQTRRITNLQEVLSTLARAKVDWSIRNRIVIETQRVERAVIICSNRSGNSAAVRLDSSGIAKISGEQSGASGSLVHFPNLTGTVAYSAIRYIRFLNVQMAGAGPTYEAQELNPNDPEDYNEPASGDEHE